MNELLGLETEVAVLRGERGERLAVGPSTPVHGEDLKFEVLVVGEWFRAKVPVFVSMDRITRLLLQLSQLVEEWDGRVEFMSEDGNFGVTLTPSRRGGCSVHGMLLKTLAEDQKLAFEFETTLPEVELFVRSLPRLIQD